MSTVLENWIEDFVSSALFCRSLVTAASLGQRPVARLGDGLSEALRSAAKEPDPAELFDREVSQLTGSCGAILGQLFAGLVILFLQGRELSVSPE